jgi:hypothetical protein
MDKATESLVRTRAAGQCEYCRLPERLSKLTFAIDHVVARQHGGTDDPENLVLACGFCNRHKGPNIAGLDPDTQRLTRLFHPRRDFWHDHFRWDGPVLAPRTDVGRTTVVVLAINHPHQHAIRQALMHEGAFPTT